MMPSGHQCTAVAIGMGEWTPWPPRHRLPADRQHGRAAQLDNLELIHSCAEGVQVGVDDVVAGRGHGLGTGRIHS